MEWTPGGTSQDIEDRRDDSGGGGGGFGFGGGLPLGLGGTLVLLVLSFIFRTNFFALFSPGHVQPRPAHASGPAHSRSPEEEREYQFVSVILDDVQATWDRLLPEAGRRYQHAKLVLFRDAYPSGCGTAESATGPFYCPEDEKVYLDLGFFDELQQRFGAPGEFARAYVIAHEVGHHVQKLIGIEPKVRRLQHSHPEEANPLSVRLELQADCFAGVWGQNAEQRRHWLDQRDIASGLQAAAAVGDDRLQRMATGHVSPERFTHGSSAQRVSWFKRGFDSGQIRACNTFTGPADRETADDSQR